MTIFEEPRLPVRPMLGELAIAQGAWRSAARLLPTYRGRDGDHEGIVFLLGSRSGDDALVTTAVAPNAEHDRRRVLCTEQQMLEVIAEARKLGLALIAQLHSHPGDWTDHSKGDDELVFMPYEGMVSFVAPHYGMVGLEPVHSLGIHQFQGGRWVMVDESSACSQIRILPRAVDLR